MICTKKKVFDFMGRKENGGGWFRVFDFSCVFGFGFGEPWRLLVCVDRFILHHG